MAAQIYIRRGTKAELNSLLSSTPLATGELGYTTDSDEVYIGDGLAHHIVGRGHIGDTAARSAYDTTSAHGKFFVDTDESNKLYIWNSVSSGWMSAGISHLADMSGTLDDIDDGSTYGRVLQSVITNGKVNQIDDGTYNVTASGLYDHITDADKHRTINDTATGVLDLWSASKIETEIQNNVQGIDTKESVRAVETDSDITLSGLQTIDGVSLSAGDRVLLTAQSPGTENGIYIVDGGSWTRSSDLTAGDTAANAYCWVEEGTDNADTGWVCTNNSGSDVVGTDALAFTVYTHSTLQQAGSGLISTGNTLDVLTGPGLYISSDAVTVKIDTVSGGNISQALSATDDGLGIKIDDYSIKENASNELFVRRVDGGRFV